MRVFSAREEQLITCHLPTSRHCQVAKVLSANDAVSGQLSMCVPAWLPAFPVCQGWLHLVTSLHPSARLLLTLCCMTAKVLIASDAVSGQLSMCVAACLLAL
jgi:hypothetical protein